MQDIVHFMSVDYMKGLTEMEFLFILGCIKAVTLKDFRNKLIHNLILSTLVCMCTFTSLKTGSSDK